MISLINCFVFVVSVFWACVLSNKLYSNRIVKSNMYAEENVLSSSLMTKSRLACMSYCAKFNSCDMMIIKQINNDNSSKSYLCKNYEIVNNVDINLKDFPDEIWYKQEILLKIMNGKDDFEVTTIAPCPLPFVQLTGGCYYITSFDVIWEEAVDECKNIAPEYGSTLASFRSLHVSCSQESWLQNFWCIKKMCTFVHVLRLPWD